MTQIDTNTETQTQPQFKIPIPFTEILIPKRETEFVIRVIEVPTTYTGRKGPVCMHLFENACDTGRTFQCGLAAQESCEFCGAEICDLHFSDKNVYVENEGFIPCEACARLTHEQLVKMRELRMELNK